MPYRPHGRARVDPRNPRAFGICDRCSLLYNLGSLRWQFDWRGNQLMNLQIRVCATCYDTPQEQFRPIKTPADPVPIRNPRPEIYAIQEASYIGTEYVPSPFPSATLIIVTEGASPLYIVQEDGA